MEKRSDKRTKLQKGQTAQGTEFYYYLCPVSVLSPSSVPKKKTKTKPVRIRKSTNKLG
jgi:hypothetical protein